MADLLRWHIAIDLATGLALLSYTLRSGRLARAPFSLARALLALGGAAAMASLEVAILAGYGLDIFGGMHFAFVDLVIVAPLLGLAIAGRAAFRRAPSGNRLALVALGAALFSLAPIGLYARYLEPFALVVERPTVRVGGLQAPLTIGILADLQCQQVGVHEHAAVAALMAERPDVIVLPGDVFQGSDAEFERELPRLRELLAELRAPLGVYAVLGNTDTPRRFAQSLAGTGITWLKNESVELGTRGGRLVLGGSDWVPSAPAVALFDAVGSRRGPDRLALAVTHHPDLLYADPLARRPDLVIAGHTHGGQVRLPLVGALITLSKLPARQASGLHRVEGTLLYVSRGVGLERAQAPRIRFLCPPEVTLLTVEPAEE